jgi:hypothetical protein
MTTCQWRSIYDRLSELDPELQVTHAVSAASAVLRVWEARAPSSVREKPVQAVTAVREWTLTHVVPKDIKTIATEAYAAVGYSGLPPIQARRAGLEAAHAAFALHFLSQGDSRRTFTASRDAVLNAHYASEES